MKTMTPFKDNLIFYIITLVIGLTVSNIFRFCQDSEDTLDVHINELETMEANALLHRDFALLDKLWASDIVFQEDKTTKHNAEEVKNLLKTEPLKPSAIERKVEQVLFENEVAISMGNEVIQYMEGQTVQRHFTNIWKKTRDGWKLIARQATLVREK
jgi:ketosteroid isomerase-like protein